MQRQRLDSQNPPAAILINLSGIVGAAAPREIPPIRCNLKYRHIVNLAKPVYLAKHVYLDYLVEPCLVCQPIFA
jgi:hypothetical protein